MVPLAWIGGDSDDDGAGDFAYHPAPVSGAGRAAYSFATNPVQQENLLSGSTKWKPLLSSLAAGGPVDAYAPRSVTAGDAAAFHVATKPAARYRIDIYRLGFYGGKGGRLVASLPENQGTTQAVPAPADGWTSRPDWPVTDTWDTTGALSGYYTARVVVTSGTNAGKSLPVPFVVRDARAAPVLVVASTNTWEAYNDWGGKSLYPFNSTSGVPAHHATFDRPTREDLPHEQPLVYWLDQQGYDYTVVTDADVDADPGILLGRELVVVNGHAEYWTRAERDGYASARDAGTDLAFVGGNVGYWQVRLEDGGHTVIAYKEYWRDADPDAGTPYWTIRWRDLGESECSLLGVLYDKGLYKAGNPKPSYKVVLGSDPWFAGTGLADGSSLPNALGHEWDRYDAACAAPDEVVLMHAANADRYGGPADMTRYQAGSGARVLSTSTLGFVRLLAGNGGASAFMRDAFDDLSAGAR